MTDDEITCQYPTDLEPLFQDVEVPLSGEDGNAFFIIGRVRSALRDGGATPAELHEFTQEATAGDYDHVLRTVMKWVRTT